MAADRSEDGGAVSALEELAGHVPEEDAVDATDLLDLLDADREEPTSGDGEGVEPDPDDGDGDGEPPVEGKDGQEGQDAPKASDGADEADGEDQGVTLSTANYEALMGQLEAQAKTELAGDAIKPPHAPEPTPEPAPVPQPAQFQVPEIPPMELSDDEFDDMHTDKAKYMEVQARRDEQVAAMAVQAVMQGVVPLITEEMGRQLPAYYESREFLNANPEIKAVFEEHPFTVQRALKKVQQANPEDTHANHLEGLKKELAFALDVTRKVRANQKSGKRVDVRPQRGKFSPGGTGARGARPAPPGEPIPMDATQEAFQDVLEVSRRRT